jgi:hypothetical protein
MLYVDTPTLPEFKSLVHARADACVSIYLPTTPLTQDIEAVRIEFGNLVKQAFGQLEAAGFDKRRLATLGEKLDDLADDDAFWRLQANSLAVLATPDKIRTFRLANALQPTVAVSDRFHLNPLLRAISFPNAAFVLALSENDVRLIEVFSDLPPSLVRVPDLPKTAADALGLSTLNDRSPKRRVTGSEGQKLRLSQFARLVDAAIRPVLAGRDLPLILAATEPLASIFHAVNSYPHLLEETITASNDRSTEVEIAAAARPILDGSYRDEIGSIAGLFEQRAGDARATTDISDAARAATFGAIEVLLVDIDSASAGTVDEQTGEVTFADEPSASTYGIVDEIMGRALASGARVLGARKTDIPHGGELAAILRYPV